MAMNLQKFIDSAQVATEIFKLRPDYRALLLAVSGISPKPSNEASDNLLQEAEATAKSQLIKCSVTDIPHVAAWRDAYKGFGTKPQKYRNSLEALTRRVEAGLPRVNWLTDVYNAISVKHQIPLGGEDLDKYTGPPRCIRATGKEDFHVKVSGEPAIEHPDAGEVVWCDDVGVTCRRWNWRQGTHTTLDDNTTSALFIMDALQPCTDDALIAAADELVETLKLSNPNIETARRVISMGP